MTAKERRELLAIVRSWNGWKNRHMKLTENSAYAITYGACIDDIEKFLKESKEGKYE